MSVEFQGIGKLTGIDELKGPAEKTEKPVAAAFGEALKQAVQSVDGLQFESEAAQGAYARGEDVDLHDVLIKIEEADMAFRAMMTVRTKLVEAYQEVMRMGSGG